MKKTSVLIILLVLLTSCGTDFQESDGMIRTKSIAGKFGFKDKAGKQIIDNSYENATDFKNGISIITVKNKKSRLGTFQGVINKKGKLLIKPKYLKIEFIDEKFIKVCKEIAWNDKLCSVYDLNGKEIIPMVIADAHKVYDSKYFDCSMNNNGTAHYLFGINGKKITDFRFNDVSKYSKDIVILRRDGEDGSRRNSDFKVYDLKNLNSSINKLNSSSYIELFNPESNRTDYLFKKYDNYIFNINGNRISAFKKYKRVSNYGEGFFVVENNDTYLNGYSDIYGNLKFNFVFIKSDAFKNGKAKVSIGGDSDFYIDKNGKCLGDCPSKRLLEYMNIKNWKIDKTEYKRLVSLGLKQMDYKNYNKAIEYFTESINSFSMDYEAFYNRGISNFMENNIKESIKDFDKSIELNSENANSYYLRGSAYQKNGETYNAIYDFEKSIKLNPNNSDPYMKLAIVYGKQGNKIKSCEFMSKACDLGNYDACNGYNKFCE